MHPTSDDVARPCFIQADLLVRSLFADPELGYSPPFLIVVPTIFDKQTPDNHARVLFETSSFAYPVPLLGDWPTGCGAERFPEPDCTLLDIKNTYTLMEGSSIVQIRSCHGSLGIAKWHAVQQVGLPGAKERREDFNAMCKMPRRQLLWSAIPGMH
jgi:hypothetical protein